MRSRGHTLADWRKAVGWWVRRVFPRRRKWRDFVGEDWPHRSRRARREFLDRIEQPQTLRLARKGKASEGDISIGRISNSDQFACGLLLTVGRSPLPPGTVTNPKVRAYELVMNDGSNPPEVWASWLEFVQLGTEAVRHGEDVLCCCDLAISRSTILAAACVARLDGRALDLELVRELRNTHYDGIEGGEFLPSGSLWREASAALRSS